MRKQFRDFESAREFVHKLASKVGKLLRGESIASQATNLMTSQHAPSSFYQKRMGGNG